MKAVILGKAGELRIQNKNYQHFYGELSLVDILIDKLLKVLDKDDIFLSCERDDLRSVAEQWGINFILRDEKYTSYAISYVELIKSVCTDIPGNEDLLWCSPIEPFFNEYREIVDCWNNLDKDKYDSLNVLYPSKKFMLDQNHNPIGFGFGHWHKYTQTIPPVYQISWATAILSYKCINEASYLVGKNPYWYDSYAPVFDIDTKDDWNLAKDVYKLYATGA
jgi:N-acylneuraminate cytidylyltransferase